MTVISFFSDKLLSESLRSSFCQVNIKPLTYDLPWNSFLSSPASSWVPLSLCWTILFVTLTIYLWQFLPDSIQISSLVASQSVMSLRPLNRQIAKSHFSVRQGLFLCHHTINFELGGFSIGYVPATSEPTIADCSEKCIFIITFTITFSYLFI